MEHATDSGVRVVSRRMVRPLTPPATANGNGCHLPKEEVEVIHLTPWDLRLITIDYIQKGILLPKPPVSGDVLVNALESSFAHALGRFYPFAGRLASEEHSDGTVSVFLRCTGEGAEFVHAVAPGIAVADIVSSLYTPAAVWAFYSDSFDQVLGADAAIKSLPLVSVQVTELADGVFIGMSLNHSVGGETAFWHFFNTWSEIHRAGGVGITDDLSNLSTPPPVLLRWFVETCPVPFCKLEHIVRRFERTTVKECFFPFCAASVKKLLALVAHLWRAVRDCFSAHELQEGSCVRTGDGLQELFTLAPVLQRWFIEPGQMPIRMPIFKLKYILERLEGTAVPTPMPFSKLEHIVKKFQRTTVKECFFTFSAASVKKLKAQANAEIAGTAAATATISSLQAVLAHLWRGVCRARRLPPEQATLYSVVIGCRGRVYGIPPGYVGNAMVFGKAEATAGEIEEKGLGWTAWLLNRAVASFDEASMRESLAQWVREPDFTYMGRLSSYGTALVMGSSPRFDVFGNDFGWGKPLAVRSGAGNKVDGQATVLEGPEQGGSMSLEVGIAPGALASLVADEEFMNAVSLPLPV